MNYKTKIVALLLLLAVAGSVTARDLHDDVGTTAYSFLKIGVGARSVAMGGAFTGLADDAAALYYNPAGIARQEKDQFMAGYLNYFADIQSGFAAWVHSLNEKQTMAIHASYLNYGEFIEADTSGNTTGNTFSGGDVLLAASYARKLRESIRVGLTAKFIFESIEDYSSSGIAVDLGLNWVEPRDRHGFGIAVQNLGTQLSALGTEKYDLPLTFRGGGFIRPRGLPLNITGDVIFPLDNNLDVAIGGEYHELKPFYIRAGYSTFGSNYRTRESEDGWAGLSLGVGFDYKQFHIAYAFSPGAELGENHRITFSGGIF